MSAFGIVLVIMVGLVLTGLSVWSILALIRDYKYKKMDWEIELKKAEAEKMYFTFSSEDDKVIKAFRIVADKNVNIHHLIDCCERYTDPLFEYNRKHCSLTKKEFELLREVLVK